MPGKLSLDRIQRRSAARRRRGVAAVDYVLTMGIILPLAVFLFWVAPSIMNLVYEMTSVLISWPFL